MTLPQWVNSDHFSGVAGGVEAPESLRFLDFMVPK